MKLSKKMSMCNHNKSLNMYCISFHNYTYKHGFLLGQGSYIIRGFPLFCVHVKSHLLFVTLRLPGAAEWSPISNIGHWLLGNQSVCWCCISLTVLLGTNKSCGLCVRGTSTYIETECAWYFCFPNNFLWKEPDRERVSQSQWMTDPEKIHMHYMNDVMHCNEYFV